MARHRRSRSKYKKLSDAVFTKTGLPLSRLLSILAGLVVVGALVAYVLLSESESSATSAEMPSSEFDSGGSDAQNFLKAGTLPPEFAKLSLPEKIEQVDSMIVHCQHLLMEDGEYKEDVKDKLISLHALKCITMAENGINPTSAIEEFERTVSQVANSEAKLEEYRYLIVFVHMTNLALLPSPQQYDKAMSAIDLITESTPVLPSKMVGSYNSALQYYNDSGDKVAATKLLQALGEKMAAAKEENIAELGLSLLDHPIYSNYVLQSFWASETISGTTAKTDRLLELLRTTPPQSAKTLKILLELPEFYLARGDTETAKKVLEEIATAADGVNEQFKETLRSKVGRTAKRIELLGKPFSFTGTDVKGRKIRPNNENKSVVLFWSSKGKNSLEILARIHDSSLYDQWSTKLYVATTNTLPPKELSALEQRFPRFRFLDFQTSKNYILNVGVSSVPYLMTVDKNGIVERLSSP